MITVKRKAMYRVLYNATPEAPILLPYSKEEMIELFFDEEEDKEGNKYYKFNPTMLRLLNKIDCRNLPFDNVKLSGVKLLKTHNICFNPQNLYGKDLRQTELDENITIIGNEDMNQKDLFEGVKLTATQFNGCKNVRINPQTIFEKDLTQAKLKGVDFTGFSFDGCSLWETNFKGSIGAKINPNKVISYSQINSLEDVELLDLPDEEYNNRSPKAQNQDKLDEEVKRLQVVFKEMLKDQLPEEKEEPLPAPVVPQKQRRKWF